MRTIPRRVVVTGMGALTPIGNNLQDYWAALLAGTSGAAPITKFDTEKFKTKFACELKNFDLLNHFERTDFRKYDPFTLYALVAAEEAVRHAGLASGTVNRDRVGVIWGSGNGGIQTFQDQVMEYALGDGTPRFSPYFIPRIIVDIASGIISMKYGFRGPNFTTISACASANTAIIDAMNYIRWGKADVILTGGSEAAITQSAMGGFSSAKALSTRNEEPATASRPFDVTRDGFVMGEGAGALVLEAYEHAVARGATIYAEVAGGGMSGDAYHLTATHPEGEGAILAMRAALEDAELHPEDIDYLNPHATSTPLGDVSEMKAVATVFGRHISRLHISATKSATGHLLGAAGAVEAIATVMAVHEGKIPPTINTTQVDPALPEGLQLTLGKSVTAPVRAAMCSTFGFGGHNAISVFKKVE
jgi:3-oxoacyl-[acyl-carrier-protein] synthase II